MFETTVRFEMHENSVFISSSRVSAGARAYSKHNDLRLQSATKMERPATPRTKARQRASSTSVTQLAAAPLRSMRRKSTDNQTIPQRCLFSCSSISTFAASLVGGPVLASASSRPDIVSSFRSKTAVRCEAAAPSCAVGSEAAAASARPRADSPSSPVVLRPMAMSLSTHSVEPSSASQAASWPSSRQLACTSSREPAPSSASLVSPRPTTGFDKPYNRSRNSCLEAGLPAEPRTSQIKLLFSLTLRRPSQVEASTAVSSSAPGISIASTFSHSVRLAGPQVSSRSNSQMDRTAPDRRALPAGASNSTCSLSNQSTKSE
mmetsp:Transcript_53100/g.172636  ORF Transcript_53100/g.172636 Transcript_53100/m.172636 type:complete len:319 (+) Transcript_53100:2711-3667(+)